MANTLGILFLEMAFARIQIRLVRLDFSVPENTKGVRSFLGLANFYRRFIKGFSKLAAPLNQLLHKCVRLKWDESCQNAFDALKHALSISNCPSSCFPRISPNPLICM